MEVPTGNHIRRWRKSLSMTQARLAELSGVAQSIIAKVENEPIVVAALKQIALGVLLLITLLIFLSY